MSEFRSLFRKESMDQLSQQATTGPYVSTSRLMPWLTLLAILILLVSFLVWSFAGKLPVTVSCRGFAPETGNICKLFLTPQQMQTHDADLNDDVRIVRPNGSTLSGKVTDVSDTPLSRQELSDVINSDWIYYEIVQSEYNYTVTVEVSGQLKQDDLVQAVITTDHVVPIALILDP